MAIRVFQKQGRIIIIIIRLGEGYWVVLKAMEEATKSYWEALRAMEKASQV